MKPFIVILFGLLIIGCSLKRDNVHTTKNEYYANGKLKSSITYLNDTLKDGEALYYDLAEQPGGRAEYLSKREFYKKGVIDSISISYYPDGNEKEMIRYYKKYPISYYEFYQGKTIKKYTAKGFWGDIFCTVDYDPTSNETLSEKENDGPEGDTHKRRFTLEYDSTEKKSCEKCYTIDPSYGIKGFGRDNGRSRLLYAGDSLGLTFLAAQPPECYEWAVVGVYKINKLADTVVYYQTPGKEIYMPFRRHEVNNPGIVFDTVFKEKGTYQIICAGSILEKNSIFPKNDTVSSIWKVE